MTTIGIVSPGAMGSALGRAWRRAGPRAVATVTGRSERTRTLAAGLELLPDLDAVVTESDIVVSVCPPDAARDTMDAIVAAAGRTGATPLLADLNAISPAALDLVAQRARAAGLDLVDGAVSGPPPTPGGSTVLYLSGTRAERIAQLPADGIRARVVGPTPGLASGVKMCTASVHKGMTALWLQALRTADTLGVVDVVMDDLTASYPELAGGIGRAGALAVSKSGRFAGEMEQIADTQAAAGLGSALFDAMAQIYGDLSHTELARTTTPERAAALTDLAEVLSRTRPPG